MQDSDGRGAPGATDRRAILRGAAGLSVLPVGGLLSGCGADGVANPTAGAGTEASALGSSRVPAGTTSFTIAVLPDTQFYSRYATTDESQQYQRKFGSEPFSTQTKWIAANAADYSIPFCIHLGDLVDQVGKPNQWIVADAAMKVLENAKIPYSVLAGNHDVVTAYDYRGVWDQSSGTDAQRNNASEPYIQWFPASRAAQQTTFRERDSSGWHEYHVFEQFGVKFMVLSLSWRISDRGIAWARDVIARNPTLPVILVNHQLLNIDADAVSPLETEYGKMLWERLIRDNDQIFLTLNGHHHGAAWLTKTNDFGNPVEEMVVDYQMDYQGGNGLMRLYEFDFTANKIDVMSFSPWVVQKPKNTLNQFDFAELTGVNEKFTIPIDFRKRFAGFTRFRPTWATGGTPILPRVREKLLAGYVEPTPPVLVPPRDTQDFAYVSDAYVHWRVADGVQNGAVVQIGDTLPDAMNKFPMTRAPLQAPAQVGDVTWSTDRHYLSSAAGSVRFANSDKVTKRANFFTTAPGAEVNGRSFWSGYTAEAFIKIDKNWTRDNNRWCNILARGINRGSMPGFAGGDKQASPLLFAISSLKELQWEVVPASNSTYPQTNWSGEIMVDTWYHVAIVNDPKTGETIMYVDGAPVLRNIVGQSGMRSINTATPWVIGASWWDGSFVDGFLGQIGEIRLVPRPLTQDQWLTARRAR